MVKTSCFCDMRYLSTELHGITSHKNVIVSQEFYSRMARITSCHHIPGHHPCSSVVSIDMCGQLGLIKLSQAPGSSPYINVYLVPRMCEIPVNKYKITLKSMKVYLYLYI